MSIDSASGVSASMPDPVIVERPPVKRTMTNCQALVRPTNSEKQMLDKRVQAALDHAIEPDALPVGELTRSEKKLKLVPVASSNQGPRPANEDEHVIVKIRYGDLFAICDGHGRVSQTRLEKNQPQPGQEFSRMVAQSIQSDLSRMLEGNLNTQKVFEEWAEMIHHKLPKEIAGTTAAIGFVEKINRFFHVANIGDSKIVVFRMKDTLIYPIPMTPEVNWSSPSCVAKVREILSPEEFEAWQKKATKERRFPPDKGVNLSSSLGDHMMTVKGKTALTHKPECTLLQLQEGDLIVLGCDGLFDFVTLDELIEQILQKTWNNPTINLAQLMTDYALKSKKSSDNVTVITVRVSANNNLQIQSSLSTASLS